MSDRVKVDVQFMEMVQQNEGIIYKVASFYADYNQPISDLYQEIILNLWKAYPSFRNESKVSTWMYRIALNTCISYYRRNKKPIFYSADIVVDIPNIPDQSEDIRELYVLISRLGKIERALILLYLEEKSHKEIAEITGLSLTNISTKISRIKEKLKRMSNM